VTQIDLFAVTAELPEGFVYKPEFISRDEERALVAAIAQLDFAQVKMHGVIAKRRVVHFGMGYEYESAALGSAPAIPQFLLLLRQRVGELAGRNPEQFAEVLVTDYPPGAGIGWHRDAPAFEIIVGVSVLGECTMQFRPWPVEKKSRRCSKALRQIVKPRSAYVLHGASRARWQHHIPPAKARRLSITFRTLRS
jgi:alkylated DNA repair dioxygenase AlkB